MSIPSGKEATTEVLKDRTFDVCRNFFLFLSKLDIAKDSPRTSEMYDYSVRSVDIRMARAMKKNKLTLYTIFTIMQILVVVVFAFCEVKQFIKDLFERADGI